MIRRLAELARTDRERFVGAILEAADSEGSSLGFDEALALVPEDRLAEVAERAVAALRRGADPSESQAAEYIVRLSLQAPESLTRHLPFLWDVRPNARSYYALWPWRGAQTDETRRLVEIVERGDPEDLTRAWRCLLEARSDEAWRAAFAAVGTRIPDVAWADACIALVGAERRAGGARRLFSPATAHLVFPEGVLRPPPPRGSEGWFDYPTWRADGEALAEAKLGGTIDAPCGVCGRPLQRLLETPSNVSPALFVTCPSCVGLAEEVLFFRHASGAVEAIAVTEPKEPEFPTEPLPETTVRVVASAPRWRMQDWAVTNGRENLKRLGGEPTWIQDAAYPECPGCKGRMPFAMQLDSFELQSGHSLEWGGDGILYAFWCAPCAISATLWQCT